MRRSKRLSRRLRLEAWTASDVARQQLGWYVRNCALSPAAGMLESVMLQRLDRLKGAVEGDIEDLEFDDNASFDARNMGRRRRELRWVASTDVV